MSRTFPATIVKNLDARTWLLLLDQGFDDLLLLYARVVWKTRLPFHAVEYAEAWPFDLEVTKLDLDDESDNACWAGELRSANDDTLLARLVVRRELSELDQLKYAVLEGLNDEA